MILLPDEKQAAVFNNDILPHLEEGNALAFATVSTFTAAQSPPEFIDVFTIAPKSVTPSDTNIR